MQFAGDDGVVEVTMSGSVTIAQQQSADTNLTIVGQPSDKLVGWYVEAGAAPDDVDAYGNSWTDDGAAAAAAVESTGLPLWTVGWTGSLIRCRRKICVCAFVRRAAI